MNSPSETEHVHHHHSGVYKRRKKSLYRRVRHRVKGFLQKHWRLICVILIALITAFYMMPSLIRFFEREE